MRTKKDERGQKHKLKMNKVKHQMRQDQENAPRNVTVRVKMNNIVHQK